MAPRAGPVVAPRMGPVAAPHFASGAVGVRTVGARTVVTPSGVVVARGPFFFPNRFHRRVFFNTCFNGFNCSNRFFFPGFGFGFGTGFGLGLGATYLPYYPAPYYPSDYSSPAPYYPAEYNTMTAPQTANQENANDVYLAAMLQKLTDEVEEMKNDQKSHAGSGLVLGPSAKADTAGPAVIFVFHDGTRINTHNYAIAGQTIWVFSENQARKYRLADLDRAATEQANAANGIELRLPEPSPAH
jgi:hypothetical protein